MSDNPLAQSMRDFGVVYTPAEAGPGQHFWRLLEGIGPVEIGGNHTIYVETLGLDGQRAVGVRVQFWNGGNVFKASEPKPGEAAALDFPIFAANNAYGVRIADGLPTDVVFGMGLIPFHAHVSYRLVFQLMVAGASDGPTEPPAPGMSAREAIERAQNYFAQGQQLLDYARGQLP